MVFINLGHLLRSYDFSSLPSLGVWEHYQILSSTVTSSLSQSLAFSANNCINILSQVQKISVHLRVPINAKIVKIFVSIIKIKSIISWRGTMEHEKNFQEQLRERIKERRQALREKMYLSHLNWINYNRTNSGSSFAQQVYRPTLKSSLTPKIGHQKESFEGRYPFRYVIFRYVLQGCQGWGGLARPGPGVVPRRG